MSDANARGRQLTDLELRWPHTIAIHQDSEGDRTAAAKPATAPGVWAYTRKGEIYDGKGEALSLNTNIK